ncbi:ATP-dependent zinc metalloprotease FtsH [Ureaplasma parvum]|uniref:ATP-dependent zinc metalloprotease FtsH n=3 Tax=Ureaplasma TaxID=2129 RepID=FTSH_UREP2|nr:ATP-dependent zinc metalloprotease FtsH [Ureaplasma parvum]B1AI94.1 RecName: Full=ATP-dependent zinc metalloprotease FtsH [Ureaplasma parvum serovar 3 str. ATCC 27815]pir/D82934/ ATP-dependent zinc metallopeptidase, cell division protein UU105 [imported] - Ureaplasma urealyticum [Ureaplasma urealyticum]AAF30511.1 ATP-dependent zinc metallopeptidase - cell division protein [Ureaplasma parvum serovar 3 str. ATCC 700970]ACA32692.1 ATP-dependent zinc metallopeptidase - cell division protein [Ure
MYFLKKIVNLFSSKIESEDNNVKKDDLTQPRKQSPEARKRRNRRIIFWLIILLIIGTIIGVIIYFSVRKEYDNVIVKSAQTEVVNNKKVLYLNTIRPNSTQITRYTIDEDQLLTARVNILNNTNFQIISNASSLGLSRISFNIVREGVEKFKLGETNIYAPISGNTNNQWNWLTSIITQNAGIPSSGFNPQVIISPLISIIFFIIFLYIILRVSKAQSDSLLGTNKANAKLTKSGVRFSDVAGIAEVKEELIEIVDFLKEPKKYVAAGARIPKGVMLYGPPGTGKTLIAKAVAGEANVPFFQTTGSSFEDTFVGVGARRVRELFEKARKSAPAIIFIDEIDSVAKKRGNSLTAVQDQTINQLLSELDGFDTSSGVIVMAATNRLDTLDDAILRPGRFDRQISVNLPDILEREQILRIHSRNKNLSAKVSLEDIARRTAGFSGAQLENVLNEAALLSVRDKATSIHMNHLDEAIDRVIAGPSRPNKVISEREREQVSYHEAGHALIGLYSPGADVVQKITIVARGRAAGYTLQTPERNENILQNKTELISRVRTALGGRAAEELIYGPNEITTGAANDFYKITNIVRAMVASFGMTDVGLTQYIATEGVDNPYRNSYSEQTALAIDIEIEKIIQREYKIVKEMINEHREELELIVQTLLELETILKPQIDYIHQYKQLPPEVIANKNKREASQKQANSSVEEAKVVDDEESIKDKEKDQKSN